MCPHGPLLWVVCWVYGMFVDGLELALGPLHQWRNLIGRQNPLTEVLFHWALVALEWSPLANQSLSPHPWHTLSPSPYELYDSGTHLICSGTPCTCPSKLSGLVVSPGLSFGLLSSFPSQLPQLGVWSDLWSHSAYTGVRMIPFTCPNTFLPVPPLLPRGLLHTVWGSP